MEDVKQRSSEAGGAFADLPELETERLLLRRMRLEDAEAMFAYASDPEVTRYVLFDTSCGQQVAGQADSCSVDGCEERWCRQDSLR